MKFVPSLADWEGDGIPSAVTIGMFDGVHRGHQGLLRMLREGARDQGLRTVALTFDQHPRQALSGRPAKGLITCLPEKLDLLSRAGVDLAALIPVAGGILSLEAGDFVRQFLVDKLHARLLVVGYDFRFGRDRKGDFPLLRAMGSEFGYTVLQSPPVLIGDQPVKSTRVRACLEEGDLAGAVELLGRRYQVEGQVVPGDGRGRQLGFPTANIRYPVEKLLPAPGVYAGFCCVDGARWSAAINLGVRPTITQDGSTTAVIVILEAYLVGFTGDLYGKTVAVEFGERLRGEQRFAGLEALTEQIRRDVDKTIRWAAEGGGQVVAA